MLETSASVVQTADGRLWLETRPRSACSGCAGDRCATAALSKQFGAKRNRFPLEMGAYLQPGDEVVIGISDDMLVRASACAYLVPLAAMILVAALADALGAGEGWQSLSAFVGLVLGFVLVRWISGRSPQWRFSPQLRRAGTQSVNPSHPSLRRGRDISVDEQSQIG